MYGAFEVFNNAGLVLATYKSILRANRKADRVGGYVRAVAL